MKQSSRSVKKQPPYQKKAILILGSIGAVVLLTILGVAGYFLIGAVQRSGQIARFSGRLNEYLVVPKDAIEKDGYIKGKVVAINQRDKMVDDLVFFQLPSELRASSPDEVGTIVLLRWGSTTADRIVYRGNSYVGSLAHSTCDVQIVDPSIPAVVGRCYFVSKKDAMDVDTVRPIQEIIDYLTHLPREGSTEPQAPSQDWTVLFRSADPQIWNTDRSGENLAIPVRRAHKSIRFLRLKRMDTGEYVILPITHQQLKEEGPPNPSEGFWWNGTARPVGGHNPTARYLGVLQNPPPFAGRKGVVQIGSGDGGPFTGSGFGEKAGDNQQAYCWLGKEIPKTAFEVAVTNASLTAEETPRFLGLPHEEGPAPTGWTVLFRSDDPLLWNTFSNGASLARPVCQAHSQVHHLRLNRMDTGEAVIVPITRAQLLAQPSPLPQTGFAWNGNARNDWGGIHMGILQAPAIDWREAISVLNDGHTSFTGWGFGHKIGVNDRQYQVWRGKEILGTVFEVAVCADPLTEDEKRLLPVPQRFYKPLPKSPPGTLVPMALVQPAALPKPADRTVIDLIPLMDQSKDVVLGRWLIANNVVHCNDQSNVLRMQIPYQPPEEYDFTVTFSQPNPRNGVALIMPNPRGGSFFWLFGYHGGVGYQLHGTPNREGSFPQALPGKKAYTTTVQVRRDGVKALLDGKVLLEHRTDFRDLGCDGYREIPNQNLLGIACDDPTVFHYIQLIEISGSGKKIR